MNSKEELKNRLQAEYIFTEYITTKTVRRRILSWDVDQMEVKIATLEAGLLRVDKMMCKAENKVAVYYEVFVKDAPDSGDWICFETIETCDYIDRIDTEDRMIKILFRVTNDSNLSFTECNFEQIDSDCEINKKGKEQKNGKSR